jgi:hypothetical protein
MALPVQGSSSRRGKVCERATLLIDCPRGKGRHAHSLLSRRPALFFPALEVSICRRSGKPNDATLL